MEAVLQSRFGSGLTGENLRRIRGDLITDCRASPEEVDGLTIQELVDRLRPPKGQSDRAVLPWRRASLAIALLIVLEFSAVMGALHWGDGDNPLQKIGNCWWLLAFVFAVVSLISRFIVGRNGWSQVKKRWHSWKSEA